MHNACTWYNLPLQILMNVWSSHPVMRMLCVPTHLGPLLVSATMDTEEMGSRVQVRASLFSSHT